METEREHLRVHVTHEFPQSGLLVSVTAVHAGTTGIPLDYDTPRTVALAVSRRGDPPLSRTLGVGGALLYETPQGVFEVRVHSIYFREKVLMHYADIGVTLVGSTSGVIGALDEGEWQNRPFLPSELAHIRRSIAEVQELVSRRSDLSPGQVDYIIRRLDDLTESAERLGRKDWLNQAVGVLASLFVISCGQT